MAGGGANMNGVSSTGTGTPSLSGNMGNLGSALGAAMGIGGTGGGTAGQAGAGGPLGANYGPITDVQSQQQLNNYNDILRGQTANTMPPPPPQAQSQLTPPAQQTPAPTSSITDYYKNILQRDPDQGGLDYWNKRASGGMSMDAIKQSFLNSQEFTGSQADQAAYAKYLQSLQQPTTPATPAPAAYVPTTTTWSAPAPQQQQFAGPTAITQSGGEGSGGAINYQYRNGGITSLLSRR